MLNAIQNVPVSANQRFALADAIIELPGISDVARRTAIIEQLDVRIGTNIAVAAYARDHVLNIVGACLKYPNGLTDFHRVLSFFYEDTTAFHALNAYVVRLYDELQQNPVAN